MIATDKPTKPENLLHTCNAGKEQMKDPQMYFSSEKWYSIKCLKLDVHSFNRSDVIAIQTQGNFITSYSIKCQGQFLIILLICI